MCLSGVKDPQGRYYIAWVGIQHPDFPEEPKVVRMTIDESYYFLEPTEDKNETKLSLFSEVSSFI